MKVDRSTKVILALIAIGLFLNAADKFSVDPAIAQSDSTISPGQDYMLVEATEDRKLFRINLRNGITWQYHKRSSTHTNPPYWQKIRVFKEDPWEFEKKEK